MPTFIVSDLHLMDRPEAYLFNREKEAAFCALVDTVLNSDAELILAGDIFDFTGLTPCRYGQQEFFHEAVPAAKLVGADLEKLSRFRTSEELLQDIKAVFPNFFKALAKLAKKDRLIYIPGNHDCDFLKVRSRLLFAKALGVPAESIRWQRTVTIATKRSLIVAHGNEYDPPNRTNTGCQNPGFVFTSALYNAVLPALSLLEVDPLVIAAIPAVRPEEAIVTGLQYHMGEHALQRVLLSFVRLLQRNGFFSGPAAVPAWFLTHNAPVVSKIFRDGVTPKRVRSLLPKEETLIENGRAGAKTLRRQLAKENPALASAIVVLGHTHELDLQSDSVNLGTWIDHITGLHPVEITAAESSLPVFVFHDSGASAVYNIKNLYAGGDLFQCPCLHSWD